MLMSVVGLLSRTVHLAPAPPERGVRVDKARESDYSTSRYRLRILQENQRSSNYCTVFRSEKPPAQNPGPAPSRQPCIRRQTSGFSKRQCDGKGRRRRLARGGRSDRGHMFNLEYFETQPQGHCSELGDQQTSVKGEGASGNDIPLWKWQKSLHSLLHSKHYSKQQGKQPSGNHKSSGVIEI